MRSLIYPPIAPLGIDDLYPGPGAGFYPHRYVLNHETSCRTHVDINCLHILNVPVLFLFVCSGIGGGGGMHVGNITSTEHFPVCLLYACACLDIHLTPYFWHNRSKWSTFLPFKSLPFPIWWPWVCFVLVSLNFAFQKSFSGTFFCLVLNENECLKTGVFHRVVAMIQLARLVYQGLNHQTLGKLTIVSILFRFFPIYKFQCRILFNSVLL